MADEGNHQDAVCTYYDIVANAKSMDGCIVLYDYILTDRYKRFLTSIIESSEKRLLHDLTLFIDVICRRCNVHILFEERILRNDDIAKITVDAYSIHNNVLIE